MPKQTSSASVKSLSGRWHITCRTALFLALAAAPGLLAQAAIAQNFNNSPPGSFMSSTQKNNNPKVIETPVSQSQDVQGQSMQQVQSGGGQAYAGQPQSQQQTNSSGTGYQSQQSSSNFNSMQQSYQAPAATQQQSGFANNNAAFQGTAVIGVTGSQQGQALPTGQVNTQMPQTQMPSQPQMTPAAPLQNQIPTAPGSATQANSNLPSDFPTLDELKQSFAQNGAGGTQTGQVTQNVQTGQTNNNQTNNNQQTKGHGTAGGVGSTLMKAIGTVAVPMAIGASMGARPMGMGMGMGMPGMGMGMGMPGMGMGMGMPGIGMGMGMPGMGMGMGMPGMGMGMNPFVSPRQMMMNSLINQGLYNGAQMLNNH